MSMIGTFAAATEEEIASLVRNPHRITAFLREKDGASAPERWIDVQKAWHAIHFLLTGKPWAGEMPLCFIIMGGVEMGDIHVGYGPARAFTSGDVRNIDAALGTISRADLMARWDADRIRAADLHGVHGDLESKEYVGEYFEELKRFVLDLP